MIMLVLSDTKKKKEGETFKSYYFSSYFLFKCIFIVTLLWSQAVKYQNFANWNPDVMEA